MLTLAALTAGLVFGLVVVGPAPTAWMNRWRWRIAFVCVLALGGMAVASAGEPAQTTAPAEGGGWLGPVTAVLETIPPEHRIWALAILAALAGWALHFKFGKDPVARAQRALVQKGRNGLSPDERDELRGFLDRHRRAEKLADEMREERRRGGG